MGIASEFLRYIVGGGLASFMMILLSVVTELVSPRGRIPWVSRGRGVAFFLVFMLACSGTVIFALRHWWTTLGVKPVVELYLDQWFGWAGWAAPAFEIIAATLVSDLFLYGYHRVQHAVLWRFHALHHCVEDLHAAASYSHWAEEVFRFALLAIPLSLISMRRGPEPAVIGFLIGFKEYLIHSSSRFDFGPLRYLLTDNVYHRIHHSKDPAHFNKNFGLITPLWDVVFGTAYFPKSGEWPDTGVEGVPEPKTFRAFLLFPLRGLGQCAPAENSRAT